MTTAHRPTWYNALGGDSQGGNRLAATDKVSSRDLSSHGVLKVRQKSQAVDKEVNKEELKKELLEKEKKSQAIKKLNEQLLDVTEAGQPQISLLDRTNIPDIAPFPEDADDIPQNVPSSDSDSDESDEDEEEADLLRELEKLKKEREEEQKKKIEEEEKITREEQKSRILRGNPLLLNADSADNSSSGNPSKPSELKRRWDDDVVFRNQAKNIQKSRKTFINDTVRSEFHKKFLAKYIL